MEGDTTIIGTLIESGFVEVTGILMIVFGAAFTLTALIVAATAGMKWVKKIGKSS